MSVVMSVKVVHLSDVRRVARKAVEQRLPLEPKDFAGHVAIWPESRLEDPRFDRTLRLGGVQTIIDLRDLPSLGTTPSLHLRRCDLLERWHIRFVRLGGLLAQVEHDALMPFEEPQLFLRALRAQEHSLRECWTRGAVLIIYPDNNRRLDIFKAALVSLGLLSDAPPALFSRAGR
jgi:hypothetical protein